MPSVSHDTPTQARKVADKALALARRLDRKIERKIYQTGAATLNLLAGTVIDISGVSQGLAYNQRVGDAIRAQSLRFRAKYGMTTSSNMTFRFILFADKRQVPGSAPSVAQVLSADSTTSTYNWDYQNRWQVYADEVLTLTNCFLNQDAAKSMEMGCSLRNLPVEFNSSAQHVRNGLYLLITADILDTTGGLVKPAIADSVVQWTAEVEFVDA